MLVLDSGGVSRLAARTRQTLAVLLELRSGGLWPPLVPSVVLVECLQGHPGRDVQANRFLKTCDLVVEVPEDVGRRAAFLRRKARRGSAIDALVVAHAEPGGIVLTGDQEDLVALAQSAELVRVERI